MWALSAAKRHMAVAAEWLTAVIHIRQNPLVRQHLVAAGRRRTGSLAIAGVLLLVIVFAAITSKEAVQWFEYLLLGKKLSTVPLLGSRAGQQVLHGPGLRLFRIGLIASYLPWLAYSVYRAAVDSLGVLSTGTNAVGKVRFAVETRLSTISDAGFVVAAARLVLPGLWLCAIGGGAILALVLWSFGAEYPGLHAITLAAYWNEILIAASMFTLSALLGSLILVLTFITVGREVRSAVFQIALATFISLLQLVWLFVLFTDKGESWLRTHSWFVTGEFSSADYVHAAVLLITAYVLTYWVLFHWAARNSTFRRALSFCVVAAGQVSFWIAELVGRAGTYCGVWHSNWQFTLWGWREDIAVPFAILNIINNYHNFEWLPSESDFWFHGLWDVLRSHMPSFLVYTLIQLLLILLLAYFARDAVVRWRRGDP